MGGAERLRVPGVVRSLPHGAVAQAYGAFNDRTGAANRFTFVLDEDGIVRDVINTEELGVAREFAAYTEALAVI